MGVVIDEAWLKEQGVEAAGEEAADLVDMTMDELELRSGMEIAGKLSDKQIAEFEKIEDDDARVDWLDKALPDYPQIVEQKIEELKQELRNSPDKVTLIKSWVEE
jgi:hypothetical protein